MLSALIEGERDVHVLAEMAKARMRPKIPQLVEALTGNFGAHHAFLCRLHLERIDQLCSAILELSERIEDQMRPFARQLEHLATIPGVGQATAEVLIAETGADMSRFRTAAHLASWAGVCPGHQESAGKRKSGKTRHGNRWLGAALGTADADQVHPTLFGRSLLPSQSPWSPKIPRGHLLFSDQTPT
jgi:transposase